MVFTTLIRQLLELFDAVALSTKTCGEIPFRQKSRVRQLREEIERLISEAEMSFGINFRLLDYFEKLVSSKNEHFTSFDKQIIIAPVRKFQFLKELSQKFKILSWHIQNTDNRQRNMPKQTLNSRSIPKECKLTQLQVEDLIEDCKILLIQSRSILDYSEYDMLNLLVLMNETFQSEIKNFVNQNLSKTEQRAYQNLIKNSEVYDHQKQEINTQKQDDFQSRITFNVNSKLKIEIESHKTTLHSRNRTISTNMQTPKTQDYEDIITRLQTESNNIVLEENETEINRCESLLESDSQCYEEYDEEEMNNNYEQFRNDDGTYYVVSTLDHNFTERSSFVGTPSHL